jgi:hypothetical protein
MARKRQLAAGMDRLVPQEWVDDSSGGGVELPSLFHHLLSCVREPKQTMTLDEARQAISITHAHQFVRMRALYPNGDGVEACLRAVLGQLTLRGFLAEQDGAWVQGPKFALGKRLAVVQNPDGSWIGITLPARLSDQPSFEEQLAQQRMAVQALAARLEPTGEGLRPVDEEVVQEIVQSVTEYGLLPGFPVLRDQHDRVLSGRHRLAAAARLGISWPDRTIKVADDLQAVRIALVANIGHAWDRRAFDLLEKLGIKSARQSERHQLIAVALQENPKRSDRAVARALTVSPTTVGSVRRELEESVQIGHFPASGMGRGQTERQDPGTAEVSKAKEKRGTPVRDTVLSALDPALPQTVPGIAERHGLDKGTVGVELGRLEDKGLAWRKRGEHGQADQWVRVTPPEQVASGEADAPSPPQTDPGAARSDLGGASSLSALRAADGSGERDDAPGAGSSRRRARCPNCGYVGAMEEE